MEYPAGSKTAPGRGEGAIENRPLEGQVALVTGAYRNLGAVTARTLAARGASVVVNDLLCPDADPAGALLVAEIEKHGVKGLALAADLSKSQEAREMCLRALDHFGRVDIVVNNAGPFNMDPYLKLSEANWDRVMDVNLKAIYLTTQVVAPQMKALGRGRIVNMCAGSAFVRNHSIYTLAKAGVQVITESLALELGPEITVNAIAPGQIAESLPDIAEFDPTFGERYTARTPVGRLVTRQEIADTIALLCTPAFDMMTGVTLRIDGGAELPRF